MTLVRYNPYRDMEILQRRINRLLDDVFLPVLGEQPLTFAPAVELSENPEAIQLKLEIPGIKAEDLDVKVTKDAVTITGERKEESKSEENGVTRSEFRYGKFQRMIHLPAKVQNTNVTAEYKDGILHLNLPKAEEEKNKVVKVNLG